MDGASALSDEELLLQVQRGDVWALELLVQRYWRRFGAWPSAWSRTGRRPRIWPRRPLSAS